MTIVVPAAILHLVALLAPQPSLVVNHRANVRIMHRAYNSAELK